MALYRREKPLALKASISALYNNLSAHVNLNKSSITYAVVHKSAVHIVVASVDGSIVSHRPIMCKEPSASHGNAMVLQARLVTMASRCILVITSQKGIQMFEADGSLMLYWYALGDVGNSEPSACFARGVCGVMDNRICVGVHDGSILVFDIPTRGTNITLAESLKGHSAAICDIASDADRVASSDDSGSIVIWQAGGEHIQQLCSIKPNGFPCTSIALWNDLVIAGFGSGHLRVYRSRTGKMLGEVTAHARCITSVDVSHSGLVLSVSEDTFARIWQLKCEGNLQIEHKFADSIANVQLQGARFIHPDGRLFGVTGYDSNELVFFTAA